MNFDDLKVIWQEESTHPSYTIDEEALHRMVMQKASSFRRDILVRDVTETGVSALLLAWILSGAIRNIAGNDGQLSLVAVSQLILAAGVASVAAFLLTDRFRERRRRQNHDSSIQGHLHSFIGTVEHQIHLLKRVVWWYLLPLIPGVILFVIATADSTPIPPWIRALVIAMVFGGVYWLNQRAVHTRLIPRKKELESLLTRLGNS